MKSVLFRILACGLLFFPALGGVAAENKASAVARTPPAKRPPMVLDSFLEFMVDTTPTNETRRNLSPVLNTNLIRKALAIRLATNAWVVFDTEKLTYAAGWIGDLDIDRTSIMGSAQGSEPARLKGKIVFRNGGREDRDSNDISSEKFHGFYRTESGIVLRYEVKGQKFLDYPAYTESNGFTQTIQNNRTATTLSLVTGKQIPAVSMPSIARQTLKWTPPMVTRGRLGIEAGPYGVDTLTIPESNPWNSWMRLTGLDFFSDGRAAVCTMSGDVWIISGIDEKLEKISWKRFATGLFEPLGLRIVKDEIYVVGRDRISRLRDLNGDGEADFYENFNSGWDVYPTYHAFNMDLQTDSKGNFYFMTCGNMVDPDLPMHGSMLTVSSDGRTCEVFCGGMRAANGMGIGPNDEITAADNQGQWTPSSRINWCKRGGFYGYGGDPRYTNFTFHPLARKPPTTYDPPLCWLPMTADNSSGGQVWATSDRWGPLKNHLLHTSYGKCALFAVMPEEVNGVWQGGAVQMPLKFESGIMRARFNPKDGQLYVVGMKGWQTSGARDGCLQRVRYTGRPLHMPMEMQVKKNGIAITFSSALDPASAADAGNYGIEQYNYLWSKEYGSADYKISNPRQKGRDSVEIKSAKLSGDRRTVFLEIPNLQPVMQMQIKFNVQAADGTTIRQEIFNTINTMN